MLHTIPGYIPCCMHPLGLTLNPSRFGGTNIRAYTRTRARGATPVLRRVAHDTPSHGPWFDRRHRHST